MNTTSKAIKYWRTRRGLTQKELAEAAKVSEISIRKYESGERSPKIEAIKRIAEALGVPGSYLSDIFILEAFEENSHLSYSDMLKEREKSLSAIETLQESLRTILKSNTDKSNEEVIALLKREIKNHSAKIEALDSNAVYYNDLFYILNLLNDNGKDKVLSYAIDLLKIPEYRIDNETTSSKVANPDFSKGDAEITTPEPPDNNTVADPDAIDKEVHRKDVLDKNHSPESGDRSQPE